MKRVVADEEPLGNVELLEEEATSLVDIADDVLLDDTRETRDETEDTLLDGVEEDSLKVVEMLDEADTKLFAGVKDNPLPVDLDDLKEEAVEETEVIPDVKVELADEEREEL